ncbi:MAG TPA: histidine kinase dimerization/phospho-acceptor domain-containing protein [Ktedonobacterales bacterium]
MTSQAPRTAHDGYELRRAPITRPLYHTAHGSTHRRHVNHVLTASIPPHYDGMLSIESYPDEPFILQHTAPWVERIGALCEEIAATTSESEAIQLVSTRIAEMMGGARVRILVEQDSTAQNDSLSGETLASLSVYGQGADGIDVPLVSGGTRLGLLRIVPHVTETLPVYDSQALRVVGVVLAQTLDLHRLRGALGQQGADAASSHERWGAFLGRVAHEVKTPLMGISGHTQLARRYVRMARDAATGELTLEAAARVVDACERHLPPLERQVAHIERLMRGMLDLAQIEHGPLPLALERCDFVALLWRAVRHVDAFENCQLALTAPDRVWLRCDARRIEQALYDVLYYAIRVGGYGGKLCVGVAVHRLNGERYVMATIGNRSEPSEVDDCAILSRRELRMLGDHVVAGVDQVPGSPALSLALSATMSRAHGGNLYHVPHGSRGGVFVLALPISGPRTA